MQRSRGQLKKSGVAGRDHIVIIITATLPYECERQARAKEKENLSRSLVHPLSTSVFQLFAVHGQLTLNDLFLRRVPRPPFWHIWRSITNDPPAPSLTTGQPPGISRPPLPLATPTLQLCNPPPASTTSHCRPTTCFPPSPSTCALPASKSLPQPSSSRPSPRRSDSPSHLPISHLAQLLRHKEFPETPSLLHLPIVLDHLNRAWHPLRIRLLSRAAPLQVRSRIGIGIEYRRTRRAWHDGVPLQEQEECRQDPAPILKGPPQRRHRIAVLYADGLGWSHGPERE